MMGASPFFGGYMTYWDIAWIAMEPYVRNTQIIYCPSRGDRDYHAYNGIAYHCPETYGHWGSSWVKYYKYDEYRTPAQAAWIVEPALDGKGTAAYNALYEPEVSCPFCGGSVDWNRATTIRHNNGGNCAFVDGHARFVGLTQLYDGAESWIDATKPDLDDGSATAFHIEAAILWGHPLYW